MVLREVPYVPLLHSSSESPGERGSAKLVPYEWSWCSVTLVAYPRVRERAVRVCEGMVVAVVVPAVGSRPVEVVLCGGRYRLTCQVVCVHLYPKILRFKMPMQFRNF